VAKYYSPNGKAIQDVSVTPSVQTTEAEPAVEEPDEDVQPEAPAPEVRPGEDPILKKGIEVLMKGVKG
jgi:C-terminal processing protease CtpA/Prc